MACEGRPGKGPKGSEAGNPEEAPEPEAQPPGGVGATGGTCRLGWEP